MRDECADPDPDFDPTKRGLAGLRRDRRSPFDDVVQRKALEPATCRWTSLATPVTVAW
jgi:hypothetical protein